MIRLVEPPARIRWTDQFYESSLGIKDPDEVKDLQWREEYHFVMSQSLMELALRRGVPCNKGLLLTRISLMPLERSMTARTAHLSALRFDSAHGPQFVMGERFIKSTSRTLWTALGALEVVLAHPRDRRIEAHWRELGGHVPRVGNTAAKSEMHAEQKEVLS